MNNKKIICFHHNDRDGIVSAAIVKYWMQDDSKAEFIPIEMNYSTTFCDEFEKRELDKDYENGNIERIFIVDYSLSTNGNVEFVDKYKDIITWIDHHLSSIQIQNEFKELKEIVGFRIIGMSGALLTYLYFKMKTSEKCKIDPTILEWNDKSVEVSIPKDIVKSCIKDNNVPKFIEYTHRYDIWDLDDEVINFSLGESETDIDEMINKIFTNDEVYNAINRGEIIYNYTLKLYENHIEKNGVFFDINVFGKTYHALMVNMIKPNSLKFGHYYDIMDILVPFYYTGNGYLYSMYAKREDIDCSEICKCFGGGGHKNAAGFYIPRNEIQLRPKQHEVVYIKNNSICSGE